MKIIGNWQILAGKNESDTYYSTRIYQKALGEDILNDLLDAMWSRYRSRADP